MFIKFIHIMAVLLGLGLLCFSYCHFCLAVSRKQNTDYGVLYLLHRWFDGFQLFYWVLLVSCGVLLIHPKGYLMSTPWIHAAFGLVASMIFFWVASLLCKYRVLSALINQQVKRAHLWSSYHMSHLAILLLAMVAIHDAVTKTTWLMGG